MPIRSSARSVTSSLSIVFRGTRAFFSKNPRTVRRAMRSRAVISTSQNGMVSERMSILFSRMGLSRSNSLASSRSLSVSSSFSLATKPCPRLMYARGASARAASFKRKCVWRPPTSSRARVQAASHVAWSGTIKKPILSGVITGPPFRWKEPALFYGFLPILSNQLFGADSEEHRDFLAGRIFCLGPRARLAYFVRDPLL